MAALQHSRARGTTPLHASNERRVLSALRHFVLPLLASAAQAVLEPEDAETVCRNILLIAILSEVLHALTHGLAVWAIPSDKISAVNRWAALVHHSACVLVLPLLFLELRQRPMPRTGDSVVLTNLLNLGGFVYLLDAVSVGAELKAACNLAIYLLLEVPLVYWLCTMRHAPRWETPWQTPDGALARRRFVALCAFVLPVILARFAFQLTSARVLWRARGTQPETPPEAPSSPSLQARRTRGQRHRAATVGGQRTPPSESLPLRGQD
jgi:hypothetical protein